MALYLSHQETTMLSPLRINFIVAVILLFMTLAQLSTDIYLPSTLVMAQDLHTTVAMVQATLLTGFVGYGVSQLWYGPLTERYGRRKFFLFGTLGLLVTSLACAVSDSITVLLLARGIQGLCCGVFSVVSRTTLRDILDDEGFTKASIYQSLVWSVIPIMAPLAGSYIQHYWGWRYSFGVLALVGLVAFGLALTVPETAKERVAALQLKPVLLAYRDTLVHSHFWPFLMVMVIDCMLTVGFFVFAPVYLQGVLHRSVIQYGWSIATVSIVFIVVSFLNRRLISSFTSKTLLTFGLWVFCLSALVLVVCALLPINHFLGFLIPMALMQAGGAMSFPHAISCAMRQVPTNTGKAAGLVGCCNLLGCAVGTLLVAQVIEASLVKFAVFSLLFSAVPVVLLRRFRWP